MDAWTDGSGYAPLGGDLVQLIIIFSRLEQDTFDTAYSLMTSECNPETECLNALSANSILSQAVVTHRQE